jgi:hypothetical protein
MGNKHSGNRYQATEYGIGRAPDDPRKSKGTAIYQITKKNNLLFLLQAKTYGIKHIPFFCLKETQTTLIRQNILYPDQSIG